MYPTPQTLNPYVNPKPVNPKPYTSNMKPKPITCLDPHSPPFWNRLPPKLDKTQDPHNNYEAYSEGG